MRVWAAGAAVFIAARVVRGVVAWRLQFPACALAPLYALVALRLLF